jgi:hypothetical protein
MMAPQKFGLRDSRDTIISRMNDEKKHLPRGHRFSQQLIARRNRSSNGQIGRTKDTFYALDK